MKKTFASAIVTCIALLGAAACDAPGNEDETGLDLEFTCDPDPVTATPSQGVTYVITDSEGNQTTYEYDWEAGFTVHIQDKGGLALDIEAVDLKVQQASGGIVITPSGGEIEHFKYSFSAAGKHIPANGSTSVGFRTWYDLPSGGREALVTVYFHFEDDDGYIYQQEHECQVAP